MRTSVGAFSTAPQMRVAKLSMGKRFPTPRLTPFYGEPPARMPRIVIPDHLFSRDQHCAQSRRRCNCRCRRAAQRHGVQWPEMWLCLALFDAPRVGTDQAGVIVLDIPDLLTHRPDGHLV